MPQLDTSTWLPQLFWLAVTFCALYFIVSSMVIPRTGGAIARRKSTIEGDLAAAGKLKSETDKAIASYEAALADARSRAQGIAAENRNRLTAEIDAERARLDATLGARTADAEKQIGTAKAKALAEVRGVATDIAASIVSKLTGADVAKSAVDAAVAQASE